MKKFEFVDITTADVAFKAYGKNLNELFANSALAMFEVMINTKQVKPRIIRGLKVKGNDLQSLMFSWLNELLVFVDSENLAFSSFKTEVDEKNFTLNAVCKGEKIDPKKHEIRTAVKACTYHQMKIEKNKIWKIQVILDI
ncbi:MAG: archease [Candidatus Aenigmarchaeota archaeon]|nr:archease [Candidatus Aenigmarchaeota archaeon]